MAMTKIYYKGYIIKSGGRNIPPNEYWIFKPSWSTGEPIWQAGNIQECQDFIDGDKVATIKRVKES